MSRFSFYWSIATALGLLLVAEPAAAEYPEKSIVLVVPYPPGGGTDNIARLLAEKLGPRLRQTIIVENKAGANGNIGAAFVAKAPADGYTLLLAGLGPLAVNPSIYTKMPFEPTKAFAPIVKVSSAPLVLVTGPSAPAGGLKELVNHARSSPGVLTAANAGEGSPQHLCAAMFAKAIGASVTHVAYRGSAAAMTDLLGGSVDIACENVGTIRPFIQAQKVRPLAVSTLKRTALLPSVPTFDEAGIGAIDFSLWFMLVAPAGTPSLVIERLNKEVNEILKTPDVVAKLIEYANEPAGGSVNAATAHLREENVVLPEIAKSIGLTRQ